MSRCSSLVLVASLLFVVASAPAQTTSDEKAIFGAVAALLEQAHISERKVDDSVSEAAFDLLLDSYDPMKLYFLTADRQEFAKDREKLDDYLKAGSVDFALAVQARFVQRVRERAKEAVALVAKGLDLTDDEQFTVDADRRQPPRDAEEAKTFFRRRVEYDYLSLLTADVAADEIKKRLEKRYTTLATRVGQETREEALARFLNAVAGAFDPHTDYMYPKAYEDFAMALNMNYEGIGALLGEEDGRILIRQVLPGGVVERDGRIKDGDVIVAVAQSEDGEPVEMEGLRTQDAVKHIRGESGTSVCLHIQPAAGGPVSKITLVRGRIEYGENEAKGHVVRHPEEGGAKIGIIDLPAFYRDAEGASGGQADYKSSARDVGRLLADFQKQEVDVVVLDLRRNGGGYLPEAVAVTGLFVDTGPVVQVKAGRGRPRSLDDRDAGVAWTGPLVVLQSRLSASASEILAGALQDYRRALIVGDSASHGKGTVQTPIDIAEQLEHVAGPGSLGVLKTTIQMFYRPGGRSTQLDGIPSDVVLPSTTDLDEFGERALPHALPSATVRAARIDSHLDVDSELVARLANRSRERRKADTKLVDFERRIAAYLRYRKIESYPLEEQAFRKLQKEIEAATSATEDADVIAEHDGEEAPEKPKDDAAEYKTPWFQEVLSIAADYANELAQRRI